jgi:hypothetical protein
MSKSLASIVFLATLSVSALAQSPDPGVTGSATTPSQQRPAPIVRNYPGAYSGANPSARPAMPVAPAVTSSQPINGVWLMTVPSAVVKTISADANGTEIRLEHGRANLQVHQPADNSLILVDLPGGQIGLVKDGLYTFNADTNTVRVLHGEAEFYPSENAKPIKIKEDHELVVAAGSKAKEVDPRAMASDLLQTGPGQGYVGDRYGDDGYRGDYGYGGYGGFGPGYGFYGGYPFGGFGYGQPFGWGYPYGFGLGFGYGGFGGGFGGGYGGGYYGRPGRFGRR